MKILVQKFGGTSVRTPEARAAAVSKVKKAVADGFTVAVVVSAMGREGEPYATDTLIRTLKECNPGVAGHELDLLMCCGEIISACVFAAELQKEGFKACALTGGQAGIETDGTYGSAHILNVDPRPLMKIMAQGIIPVVCGFQGLSREEHQMTTLGRGGSDTSAAALGVGLKASAIEIYTDVDGIMTADPRMVDNARIMSCISYGACCELAEQGAKVIHQRAVEIAQNGNIPLYVKCTFDDEPGTLITNAGTLAERTGLESQSFVNGITYIKGCRHQRELPEPVPDGVHVLRVQRQRRGLRRRIGAARVQLQAEGPLCESVRGRHLGAGYAGPDGVFRQCPEREGHCDFADRRFQYIHFGNHRGNIPQGCRGFPA